MSTGLELYSLASTPSLKLSEACEEGVKVFRCKCRLEVSFLCHFLSGREMLGLFLHPAGSLLTSRSCFSGLLFSVAAFARPMPSEVGRLLGKDVGRLLGWR